MISQVRFENFKALQQVTIDLERLTVLVGANATGKTSVLQGLHAFSTFDDRSGFPKIVVLLQNFANGSRTLGSSGDVVVNVSGDFSAEFRATPGPSDKPDACGFKLTLGDQAIDTESSPAAAAAFAVRLARTGLSHAIRLQFDPRRLSAPSYVDDEHPRVGNDGFGLASVLAVASGQRSGALGQIERELQKILPWARNLRTFPARVQRNEREYITVNGKTIENAVERTYMGQRFELEIDGVGSVPADMLSEGTLLVLGLLTVLHTTPNLRLLLLDDLDRGLHPNAQRDVVRSLRAVLDENPQLQIVCTTHSPYALDVFEPHEVRVLQLNAEGRAGCKALTDHPDWPRWRDFMNPGEFWSSVGEDWIFGERDGTP
ncbi:AAA family ATPase [Nannocystis sp.]|uniref:AAA family ATPase n=1 Tax=Nannocystis sp. TaxID=1962667 RepID=UPI0025F7A789|nr:AAA family ATPase [Nannocystis sp.]MBK7826370.1 AAA family ATPase [Nannocystis sp.]